MRAWAAIAVLLFHFKLLHFSGGFAGVDVFFVLSGYLMAAILYPQMRDFPRQLPGFYVKRLKREFPALFVLLAILLLLLPHLLIPSDLQAAAKEVKYAALFCTTTNSHSAAIST